MWPVLLWVTVGFTVALPVCGQTNQPAVTNVAASGAPMAVDASASGDLTAVAVEAAVSEAPKAANASASGASAATGASVSEGRQAADASVSGVQTDAEIAASEEPNTVEVSDSDAQPAIAASAPDLQPAVGDSAPNLQPTIAASAPDGQPATEQAPVSSAPAAALPSLASSPQEINDLFSLLTGNNTPQARRLGARKLLDIDSPQVNARLIGVLRADPPDLAAQIALCQAIAESEQHTPDFIDPLVELLDSEQTDVREAVIDALRRFDDDAVMARLRPMAIDARLPEETRLAVISALGSLGEHPEAVSTLLALAQNNYGLIQAAALEALNPVSNIEFADAAEAAAWWAKRQSMTPLEWTREVSDKRATRIRRLRREKSLLTARLTTAYREAFNRLPEIDRPQKLLSYLGDALPEIRDLGLDLVNAMITDRKDVGLEIKNRLLEMIADPEPTIRRKVAPIIGDLRLTAAVDQLLEALNVESDYRVRAAVVMAIGRLDGRQAVPVLLDRLQHDVPPVVAEAAPALANLARAVEQEAPEIRSQIAQAILDRHAQIPMGDDVLRLRLLEAMARLGAEAFRTVFKAELSADRPLSIRRGAIAGLSGYGDLSAADDIVPLTTALEPEIRLAAVAALGKCGRRESDLQVLAPRVDGSSESDQAVRQRAWEAYVEITQRLPPLDHLRIAQAFAGINGRQGDLRRLELLTALRDSEQRFAQLKLPEADRRIELLDAVAGVCVRLGDYAAAAASLNQAMELIGNPEDLRYRAMAVRSIVVLLSASETKTAVDRIRTLTDGETSDGELLDTAPLAAAVLEHVKARVDSMSDSASHAGSTRMIDALLEVKDALDGDFADRLSELRKAAHSKRAQIVDGLLEALGSDPQAETKLLGFRPAIVLPRLQARLVAGTTSSAPKQPGEERLVQLAKRLVPDWPGYAIGCPVEERAAAVAALKSYFETTPSSAPAAESTPASSPSS